MVDGGWRDRVVEVNQWTGCGEEWELGSGYRIGGPWVLTAAHVVVQGVHSEVVVRALGAKDGEPKRRFTGRCELRGDPDEVDLALVRITGPDGPDLPPSTFGVLTRDTRFAEIVENCTAVGFPDYRARMSKERVRDTAPLEGHIALADAVHAGLLVLKVRNPPLALKAQREQGLSPYSGASGSAVITGDCLIGVIKEHLTADGGSVSVIPLDALRRLPRAEQPRWYQILGTDLTTVAPAAARSRSPHVVVHRPARDAVAVILPNLRRLTAGRSGGPPGSGVDSLIDDLRSQLRTQRLVPTMILVPGGVVGSPVPAQYRLARNVIERVRTELDVPADQIVVAPSDHDVSGPLYTEYLAEQQAEGVPPRPPYAPKWRHFVDFLGSLGVAETHRPIQERPWVWWEDPAARLAVAVLNPTIVSTGTGPQLPQRLGPAQLDQLGALAQARRTDGWRCLGLLHDRPLGDRIVDVDRFRAQVEVHLDLVVQGEPARYADRVATFGTTPVLAPGKDDAAYQILALGARPTVWSRSYDPDRPGWSGDVNIAASPSMWWRDLPMREP